MKFWKDLCWAVIALFVLVAVYAAFAATIAIGVVFGPAVYDLTKHLLAPILP